MVIDPERSKLDEMSARIRQAEAKPVQEGPIKDNSAAMKASRVGFEFVAVMLACVGVGWLADWKLGIGPWGTLTMLFVGFAAAIANVWRAMKKYDQQVQ